MKNIFYRLIKYPLILIFLKTPFINILKKRFRTHRNRLKKNIFWFILDLLFEREYFANIKNKIEMRDLSDSTVNNGEGKKWAQYYYDGHINSLEDLKKTQVGLMTMYEANPIFQNMINFINKNNFQENENTYIIQLGSSSGKDLEFFLKLFPKLSFISTDINDEILSFQKKKYNYKNLQYFKCYAEDIDRCIESFNISDKNLIIFSCDCLQYVNPYYLKEFFSKIKNYKNLNFFLIEPINLLFLDNKKKQISEFRGATSFSHRYDQYVFNSNAKIVESKIIRPHSKDDMNHRNTGHFYLHMK